MRPCLFGYAVSLGSLLAYPAAAADRTAIFDQVSERGIAAGYVGATISLLQSRERKFQPRLSVGAGLRYQRQAALRGVAPPPSTFEFALAGTDAGGLYIGGRRLAATEGEGGLKTGEMLLIVAGIAVTALLVTQLAGSDDDDDDERCFIEPELCD